MPVVLPARYLDEAGTERDCALRGTGPEDLEIVGGHAPSPGERIVCRVPGLGLVVGRARSAAAGSFRIAVEAGPAEKGRLAARLAWHLDRADDASERREASRVVPIRTAVMVSWGGPASAGRLRDVSATGAAIDLASRPPVGTPVTVGRRRAHVARHTDGGIGVRFVLPLSPQDVNESVVL